MELATSDKSPIAVIAIGGNSLIKDKDHPELPHQWDAVRETASHIASFIESGWNAVITHGNGPQVGFILRRNELAAPQVHTTSLDVIVADTQGSIGYMLQQALNNEFYQREIPRHCITMTTQVRVERDDPAFKSPSKPIGGFLDKETAELFERGGWQIVEDAGRGWRRVVASPKPLEIVEAKAIEQAVSMGWTVVAVGGGGIPVTRNRKGELRGCSAVIDKDHASSLLALNVDADLFLISTGVERVAINFGLPDQIDLDRLTVSEAAHYLTQGHFAPGSMQPKIEACIRFLTESSNPNAYALITDPDNLSRALAGETGTRVVRD